MVDLPHVICFFICYTSAHLDNFLVTILETVSGVVLYSFLSLSLLQHFNPFQANVPFLHPFKTEIY